MRGRLALISLTLPRLEANSPKGTVYISGKVYEAVKDRVIVEEIGEIPLKGKSKSVFVYSLKGIREKGGNEQTEENEAALC